MKLLGQGQRTPKSEKRVWWSTPSSSPGRNAAWTHNGYVERNIKAGILVFEGKKQTNLLLVPEGDTTSALQECPR